MEALRVKLNNIRCRNEDQNHYFYPHRAIYELINSDITQKILEFYRVKPYEIKEAGSYIAERGGRRVFAILVLLKEPQIFPKFIKDDNLQNSDLDHRLPYTREKLEELLEAPISHEFWDKQWEFTAPFFSPSSFARVLPDEFILPFLNKDKLLKKGAFGKVFEIEIERSYLPSGLPWQGKVYHDNHSVEYAFRLIDSRWSAKNLMLRTKLKLTQTISMRKNYIISLCSD